MGTSAGGGTGLEGRLRRGHQERRRSRRQGSAGGPRRGDRVEQAGGRVGGHGEVLEEGLEESGGCVERLVVLLLESAEE